MKVVNLSQEQIDERYENLPKTIKETFWAASTAQRIWRLGQFYHLSDEKISLLAQIIGQVLMGFILPEDAASEIQEALGIDTRIAQAISNEIRQKIFSPLHEELSKIYNPILGSPKIEPGPSEKIEPEPAKLPPRAPLQPIEIEAFKPAAPPIADTKTELPDFEPVMSSDLIPTDKPFMIHQEAGARQVAEKKKVAMPAIGWFKKERSKMPESSIKVQLETFGPKIEERKEPTTAKTETPKQRIVHYREVENPAPFGKTPAPEGRGSLNKIERQPSKIETPAIKPFDTTQGKPEPLKSSMPGKPFGITQGGPEQSVKPAEPKVIDLESFFEVIEKKENGTKNEVGLDGNTINLKDLTQKSEPKGK